MILHVYLCIVPFQSISCDLGQSQVSNVVHYCRYIFSIPQSNSISQHLVKYHAWSQHVIEYCWVLAKLIHYHRTLSNVVEFTVKTSTKVIEMLLDSVQRPSNIIRWRQISSNTLRYVRILRNERRQHHNMLSYTTHHGTMTCHISAFRSRGAWRAWAALGYGKGHTTFALWRYRTTFSKSTPMIGYVSTHGCAHIQISIPTHK